MWFFVQLCSSWQDFNWLKASRGPSAVAELLVIFAMKLPVLVRLNAQYYPPQSCWTIRYIVVCVIILQAALGRSVNVNFAACWQCLYFCLSYKCLYSNVEFVVVSAPKTLSDIWSVSIPTYHSFILSFAVLVVFLENVKMIFHEIWEVVCYE